MGHNLNPGTAMHWAASLFANEIYRKTHGRISIEVFPNQELGTDQEMVEMAIAGNLDIILTPTAKLSAYVPAMQFADLPFLFPSPEAAYEVLDGEPGQRLLKKLDEFGLKGIAFWSNGFKQFTANRPILRPDDFQGLNIRIMKSRIIADQFKSMGANPIPIDFHKTYQALGDGIVDGQENPLVAIAGMKFYEVQSHLTISNHAFLGYVLSFNQKRFQALPEPFRKTLVATAKQITPLQRMETEKKEKEYLDIIRQSGCKITVLTSAREKQFFMDLAFITDKYTDVIGDNIMDGAQKIIGKYRWVDHGNNDPVIGLTADFTMSSPASGRAIRNGLTFAVNQINKNGGVLEKKLRVRVMDDSGIPSRTRANIEKLSRIPSLVAVMSGKISATVLACLDLVHREHIPLLIPWSSATAIVENGYNPNYAFRVSLRDRDVGPFLVSHALEKSNKVALLLINNEWGKSNESAMTRALFDRGLRPETVQWINMGTISAIPQLTQIRQSGAGVILLAADPETSILAFKGMTGIDLSLPIVSHHGIIGGRFWQTAGPLLSKIPLTFIQSFSDTARLNTRQKEILNNYRTLRAMNLADTIMAPSGFAHAHDLAQLLALAIKAAGSLNRPDIRNAME
ncbi:MAG TPA: hypothetical protein DHV36_13430, partial [Desulfobacteraceae bacterium]|nr:hypothetical protein [Desulfobacteraceae bacterium]